VYILIQLLVVVQYVLRAGESREGSNAVVFGRQAQVPWSHNSPTPAPMGNPKHRAAHGDYMRWKMYLNVFSIIPADIVRVKKQRFGIIVQCDDRGERQELIVRRIVGEAIREG
jgi:hypothetical protein